MAYLPQKLAQQVDQASKEFAHSSPAVWGALALLSELAKPPLLKAA